MLNTFSKLLNKILPHVCKDIIIIPKFAKKSSPTLKLNRTFPHVAVTGQYPHVQSPLDFLYICKDTIIIPLFAKCLLKLRNCLECILVSQWPDYILMFASTPTIVLSVLNKKTFLTSNTSTECVGTSYLSPYWDKIPNLKILPHVCKDIMIIPMFAKKSSPTFEWNFSYQKIVTSPFVSVHHIYPHVDTHSPNFKKNIPNFIIPYLPHIWNYPHVCNKTSPTREYFASSGISPTSKYLPILMFEIIPMFAKNLPQLRNTYFPISGDWKIILKITLFFFLIQGGIKEIV